MHSVEEELLLSARVKCDVDIMNISLIHCDLYGAGNLTCYVRAGLGSTAPHKFESPTATL